MQYAPTATHSGENDMTLEATAVAGLMTKGSRGFPGALRRLFGWGGEVRLPSQLRTLTNVERAAISGVSEVGTAVVTGLQCGQQCVTVALAVDLRGAERVHKVRRRSRSAVEGHGTAVAICWAIEGPAACRRTNLKR